MRKQFLLLMMMLTLTGCGGCSLLGTPATTGSALDQAIQLDQAQVMLVTSVAKQVKTMCLATPPTMPANVCTQAQADYTTWRNAQLVVKDALESWKSTGSDTTYQQVIAAMIAASADFVNLVNGFIPAPVTSPAAPPPVAIVAVPTK